MRMATYSISLLWVVTLTSVLHAQNIKSIHARPEYELVRAGVYLTSYFQSSGSSNSLLGLWSPAYNINDQWSVIGDLGGTVLNTATTKFFALTVDFRGLYRFHQNWSGDLSIGTQHWGSEGGFLFSSGLGASYHFNDPLLVLIQSVRGGIQYVAKPGNPTWQLMIGVEIGLGEDLWQKSYPYGSQDVSDSYQRC